MKVLVKCLDYNGFGEVLFMMKSDDFRLSNTRNYIVLDKSPRYNRKECRLVTCIGSFEVFSDWSLRGI